MAETRRTAEMVREMYDFFDQRRSRLGTHFDIGDAQNIHSWMLAVTEWIETMERERAGGVTDGE